MQGIISLLDSESCRQVEGLWHLLEAECGLSGIRLTPVPHFSWHIAETYDEKKISSVLTGIVRHTKPFTARAAGLAIFSGEQPVVYTPLVRSLELNELHQRVFTRAERVSQQPVSYYRPDQWLPHITLAYGDVDQQKLTCALALLAFRPMHMQIQVHSLALAVHTLDKPGEIVCQFDFAG